MNLSLSVALVGGFTSTTGVGIIHRTYQSHLKADPGRACVMHPMLLYDMRYRFLVCHFYFLFSLSLSLSFSLFYSYLSFAPIIYRFVLIASAFDHEFLFFFFLQCMHQLANF